MKTQDIPLGAKGILFVVSTSHMDWDWNATFEQYYTIGHSPTKPVSSILSEAIQLIDSTSDYQYNLAEIAWLKRYIQDNPDVPTQLATMQGRFFLLGGGITSPDNLVCNGEAFIRNYILGRAYLKKMGLEKLLTDVCWIPDDFGQDPQLPVVLKAMGMSGVSFQRVPGNQPQPPSDTDYLSQPTLSTQLKNEGVTFFWQAADGSTILTQQMSGSYGVIFHQKDSSAETLANFVSDSGKQPGHLYMAPCGGDFSFPDELLVTAVANYNKNDYPKQNTPVYAVMATFQEFIDAMNAYAVANPTEVNTLTDFDASNYWTGHFASRVQLKINQQRTTNQLMAAETLSALLRTQSLFARSVLDGLDQDIDSAWENLIPSTHHDYINGTAPDHTYLLEQLPLSTLALVQSDSILSQATTLLSQAVKAQPRAGEIPYVVFNPSGFNRKLGYLVELPMTDQLRAVNSVRFAGQDFRIPIQKGANDSILFPCEHIDSTGYSCVYLSEMIVQEKMPKPLTSNRKYAFNNRQVEITIDQKNAWAITSIVDLASDQRLTNRKELGNQIQVYYEKPHSGADVNNFGNLYQMGNELSPQATNGDGFYTDATGVFEGQEGQLIENGPYRWHFKGSIYNASNDLELTVEYFLEYDEPIVRMRVTGKAANEQDAKTKPNTIVTSWQLKDQQGRVPASMNYGTPNHWHGRPYTPYWNGPTFRSTHDYLTLAHEENTISLPIAAIYHEGMRSWALDNGILRGILFRNAPGNIRGAAGTDTDVHTQNYAFRIAGVGHPNSCQPLQESLAFQQRQLIANIPPSNPFLSTMGETGLLASIKEDNAIIRVARTQAYSGIPPSPDAGSSFSLPLSFILRIYQPTNATDQTWQLNLPFLTTKTNTPQISMVTALEDSVEDQSEITYDQGVVTIQSMPTLITLKVQTEQNTSPSVNGRH